jgi:hypothetical protein
MKKTIGNEGYLAKLWSFWSHSEKLNKWKYDLIKITFSHNIQGIFYDEE